MYELAQFRGDGTRQLILPQIQHFQLRQLAQFRGDGAGQLVVPQIQHLQLRQLAQFRGDGAGQLVVPQIQHLQLRQLAQPRRQGSGQAPVPDSQRHYPRGIPGHLDSGKIRNPVVAVPVDEHFRVAAPQRVPHRHQYFLVTAQAGGRARRGTRRHPGGGVDAAPGQHQQTQTGQQPSKSLG